MSRDKRDNDNSWKINYYQQQWKATEEEKKKFLKMQKHIKNRYIRFLIGKKQLLNLIQNGADLNCKNKDDFTPLSLAIKKNAWESAEILCQYGAKTNL